MIRGFGAYLNNRLAIYIDLESLISNQNSPIDVSTFLEPRPGKDFHSIIAGPVVFDPKLLFCGDTKSTLEGYQAMKLNGMDLEELGLSLVISYVSEALTMRSVGQALIWRINHPLVSLYELSYLYNECVRSGVDGLDNFVKEIKKKIAKRNEGDLGAAIRKLRSGGISLRELQKINIELSSKVSELRTALRYRQCDYDVEYNGGLGRGGADLVVTRANQETNVEVRTKFTEYRNFPIDPKRPFPQLTIQLPEIIDFNFNDNEKGNIEHKFSQGDIVVEDITHDYGIGIKFLARGFLYPAVGQPIREVLNEADEMLSSGGKPLVLFTANGCFESWRCIDFSRSRPLSV